MKIRGQVSEFGSHLPPYAKCIIGKKHRKSNWTWRVDIVTFMTSGHSSSFRKWGGDWKSNHAAAAGPGPTLWGTLMKGNMNWYKNLPIKRKLAKIQVFFAGFLYHHRKLERKKKQINKWTKSTLNSSQQGLAVVFNYSVSFHQQTQLQPAFQLATYLKITLRSLVLQMRIGLQTKLVISKLIKNK